MYTPSPKSKMLKRWGFILVILTCHYPLHAEEEGTVFSLSISPEEISSFLTEIDPKTEIRSRLTKTRELASAFLLAFTGVRHHLGHPTIKEQLSSAGATLLRLTSYALAARGSLQTLKGASQGVLTGIASGVTVSGADLLIDYGQVLENFSWLEKQSVEGIVLSTQMKKLVKGALVVLRDLNGNLDWITKSGAEERIGKELDAVIQNYQSLLNDLDAVIGEYSQ